MSHSLADAKHNTLSQHELVQLINFMLPCRAAHLCTVNGINIVTMFTPLAVVPLGQGCGTCRTAGPGHAAAACAHQTGVCAGREE